MGVFKFEILVQFARTINSEKSEKNIAYNYA